jgi:hypothetical protein
MVGAALAVVVVRAISVPLGVAEAAAAGDETGAQVPAEEARVSRGRSGAEAEDRGRRRGRS